MTTGQDEPRGKMIPVFARPPVARERDCASFVTIQTSAKRAAWCNCASPSEFRCCNQPLKAGDVVQLVRTLPCHGRGRGFESRRPRHSSSITSGEFGFPLQWGAGLRRVPPG